MRAVRAKHERCFGQENRPAGPDAAAILAGAVKMSVPERIRLVEDIWDSIAADASEVPVTAAQKAELDRRRRSMRKNP